MRLRVPWTASTWLARKTSLAGSSQCRSSNRVTPGSRALSAWVKRFINAKQLALARLRVHPSRGALGVGHGEEVEEQRQVVVEALVEQHAACRRSARAPSGRSLARRSRSRRAGAGARAGAGPTWRAPGRRRGRRACPSPACARRTRGRGGSCRRRPRRRSRSPAPGRRTPAPGRSPAIRSSSSRPTKREKPRARETSSRPRAAPTPVSSWTRSGRLAPLTWNSPRSVSAR